jgi:hypothetical protein
LRVGCAHRAVAMAHHDAFIRSRVTFFSSSTFFEPFARPQTACFVIAFTDARRT